MPPVEPQAVRVSALAPTVTNVLMRILLRTFLSSPGAAVKRGRTISHASGRRSRRGALRLRLASSRSRAPLRGGAARSGARSMLRLDALVLVAGQLAHTPAVRAPRLAGVRFELAEVLGVGCGGRQTRAPSLTTTARCYPVAQSAIRRPGHGRERKLTCTPSGARRINAAVELLEAPIATAELLVVDTETNGLGGDALRDDRGGRGARRRRRAARPVDLAVSHERAAPARDPALHGDHPGDGRRRAVARGGAAGAAPTPGGPGDGRPQRAV